MSISPGTRLGPYEVTGPLGAGGMGEVYRARDTRLDRQVAIKVLPSHVAAAPDVRERFDREARTVASLHHPHICVLHDVGHQDGIDFLVMECLEGETLAKRLTHGALPFEQSLAIATQIADALAAAHRAGVVHRDLKPGNIMLTGRGAAASAKLLDFGLAKLAGAALAPSGLTMAATGQTPMTAQGTILGTVQYMAPEQIEGEEADARTDIFAFGLVLYEMLTGSRAFSGKTQASLMSSILKDVSPPVSRVQPQVPAAIDHVLARCLAKDPAERWQTAADLKQELIWAASRGAESVAQGPVPRRGIPYGVAAVVTIVVAALAVTAGWFASAGGSAAGARVERLTIALPGSDEIGSLETPAVAIAPAGTHIVFVARRGNVRQLFLRAIDSLDPQPLPGTEEAVNPFFSPDGAWVGFFSKGKLRKLSIASGATQVVADAPFARGGSWAADGTIYYAPTNTSGLFKVPSDGGMPVQVTTLDRPGGEVSHRWPQVLPGGKAMLFTAWTGPGADETRLDLHVFDTGERRTIAQGADTGRYVPSGHVVYARADALMALPFDLDGLAAAGEPVRTKEVIRAAEEGAQYAVSDAGDLVYVPGDSARFDARLVWVDRTGRVEALPVPTANIANPMLSPDGRRVALNLSTGTEAIAIADPSRGTLTPLATGTGSSQAPAWTPDGKRIVYRGTRAGFRNLFWKAVDGTAPEERLTTSESMHTPMSVSPDGRSLLYSESDPVTASDVWVLSLEGERPPTPLVRTPFSDQNGQWSPDGRWVAYESAESGREEVLVQPFPPTGERWTVSTGGGVEPRWSPDGRELFYRSAAGLMAVDVTMRPAFKAGAPRRLFEDRFRRSPNATSGYSVSPDGRRFLFAQQVNPEPSNRQLHIVQHWFEELKRLVPVD